MARPTTKSDLVEVSNSRFENLMSLLESIPLDDRETLFDFQGERYKEAHWKRDKNLKDVLIHLYEWHLLLLKWTQSNLEGKPTPFLEQGYNWKTYGVMNEAFVDRHKKTSYEEALMLVKKSHHDVMVSLEAFSNSDLFSKGVYGWTGGSTLGQYYVSSTSSHYDWAIKKIKNHIRIQKLVPIKK